MNNISLNKVLVILVKLGILDCLAKYG